MTRLQRWLLSGLLLQGACAVPAAANPITNGDFATDLSGWYTVVDNGTVQWDSGQALLSTGPGTAPFSATLVQGDEGNFLFAAPVQLGSNDTYLQFDAVFADLGEDTTEGTASGFTDQLSVWVYDALDNSLDALLATIIAGDGPAFSLDISGFAGRTVAFSFELSDEADGRDSSVRIDNVRVAAVPLPAAFWLLGSGAWLLSSIPRRKACANVVL